MWKFDMLRFPIQFIVLLIIYCTMNWIGNLSMSNFHIIAINASEKEEMKISRLTDLSNRLTKL